MTKKKWVWNIDPVAWGTMLLVGILLWIVVLFLFFHFV